MTIKNNPLNRLIVEIANRVLDDTYVCDCCRHCEGNAYVNFQENDEKYVRDIKKMLIEHIAKHGLKQGDVE